jgi:hypothetical protein
MAFDRTYPVDVEGIGTFVFRRRTMEHRYAIAALALKIMGAGGGGGETPHLGVLQSTEKMAELQLLCVSGPDGWDIDALDPLDDEDCSKFEAVHKRFREAEETFRRELKAKRARVGATAE